MERKILIGTVLLLTMLFGCSKPKEVDESRFVFTSTRREAPGAYFLRDGKITLLGKGLDAPTWSTDGKYIATSDQKNTIIIFDEYGNKVKEVHAPNVSAWLAWSPDDRYIAYVAADPKSRTKKCKFSILRYIYIYDLEKGERRKVLEGEEKDRFIELNFSPQGDRLVFRSQRWDDKGGVYVINVDGTGLKRLSKYGRNPCWFPDGKHIFIVTGTKEDGTKYHEDSKASYFKIDSETGEVAEELLHEPVMVGFTPKLSRDGRYVYSDKQLGGGRIIVIIPLFGKYKGKNIPIYPRSEFGYDLSPDWYQGDNPDRFVKKLIKKYGFIEPMVPVRFYFKPKSK